MFSAMMDGIKEEAVGFLFYVQVNTEELVAPDPSDAVADNGELAELQIAGLTTSDEAAVPAAAEVVTSGSESEREKVSDVIGRAIGAPSHRPAANLQYSAPTVDGEAGVQHSAGSAAPNGGSFANASRNAPCPCGSGRKYKRCHGAPSSQ
jgi:preprotein translocase subunit SecA